MKTVAALLAGLLIVGAAGAARGGKTGPLTLDGFAAQGQRSTWLEQQDDWPQPPDGVAKINSLSGQCWWTVNEHSYDFRRLGYLDPGASASASFCAVADFNPVLATRFGVTASWSNAKYGFTGAFVYSDDPVTLTVCFQPQARCFTAVSRWDASQRVYRSTLCSRANYSPADETLEEIAGSNGGRGVVTTVTVTVGNPGTRRIRSVDVRGGFSSDQVFPQGCDGPNQAQREYPFEWTTS
jgi:hypothetical protein